MRILRKGDASGDLALGEDGTEPAGVIARSPILNPARSRIKAGSGRAIVLAIDRRFYEECHQVECFNNLGRVRRIASRCEKTIRAFTGFVISHAP